LSPFSLDRHSSTSAYRLLRTPPQATKADPVLKAPDRPRLGRSGAARGKGPLVEAAEEELQAALGEVGQIHSKDLIDSDE
jgi:hypothetical protein